VTLKRKIIDQLYPSRCISEQGGLSRFYRGVFFALLQGPLARFGATAANEAMLSVVAEAQLATSPLWMAAASAAASVAAGTWRWFIMPLDTCKTILQVILNGTYFYAF